MLQRHLLHRLDAAAADAERDQSDQMLVREEDQEAERSPAACHTVAVAVGNAAAEEEVPVVEHTAVVTVTVMKAVHIAAAAAAGMAQSRSSCSNSTTMIHPACSPAC